MQDNKIEIKISAKDQASGSFDAIQRKMTEMNSQVERTSRKFTEMKSAITGLAGAVSLTGVAMLTKDLMQAGLQLEKLNKLFNAAAGSASQGGRELEYVQQLSYKMGLSFVDAAESYGKFTAAMRGTSMEGEQGRKVFEAVSGATTALGLSAAETSGVFNALQQMISKGKVQAEELRGQLGERLPGAFKMAADAMGVSTAELDKMLQKGEVVAADLLPRLAEQLNKTYGVAAAAGAKSAQAELMRFNNTVFDAKTAIGAALMPAMTDGLRSMRSIIENGIAPMVSGLISVEAEVVRLAMLLDKLGGTMTTVNHVLWKFGELSTRFATIGQFGEFFKKQAEYSQQLNEQYRQRYEENSKRLEELASLEQRILNSVISTNSELKNQSSLATSVGNVLAMSSNTAAEAYERERQAAEKLREELERLKKTKGLESGAEDASTSFTASVFGMASGGSLLQIPADKYAAAKQLGSYSLTNPHEGRLNSGRFSIMGGGVGQMPGSNYDPEKMQKEIQTAEDQKKMLLDIEERFNEQMLASKMGLAEQSLGIMRQAFADNMGVSLALMVVEKSMAVARIIQQAEVAKMAATAAAASLGPFGIGLAASQHAQIEAMKYMSIGVIAASAVMEGVSIGGKREFGGPVVAGQSYLVGEKRAEIFTPNQSGWITPRADIGGGGITQNINIDARGADAGVLARIEVAMVKAREQAKADIMQSLNRGGAYSRAVGRA